MTTAIKNIKTPAKLETTVQSGWEAELKLGFTKKNNKTLLSHRSHRGPLTVQRPFYPEESVCHVYLLHPPGGIVAGDRLKIDLDVKKNAEAVITTPAAGKFYRSEGDTAKQTVNIRIEDSAALEWIPQETIIYQGAKLTAEVGVNLSKNARFIGWEIVALGRPAANEQFNQGEALLKWNIVVEKRPLFLERMRLDAIAFSARWGLNGDSSCGTLFAYPANNDHLKAIREIIGESVQQGVTLIDDLLICRASHQQAEPIRQFFETVRTRIRPDIIKHAPHTPRIWAT